MNKLDEMDSLRREVEKVVERVYDDSFLSYKDATEEIMILFSKFYESK